jgi:alpha-D-ribose 1-methylphosphonate 5-triphosphate synthase subunit PhnG
MVGCFIILFIRDEHKELLRAVKKCKVRTGFSGMAGNKGGVALRFALGDSTFAFINVHLESG